MRYLITAAAAMAIVASALAEPLDDPILTVTFGTNKSLRLTATLTKMKGQIEALDFDVVTANATGDLSIVISPLGGASTMSDFTLFSTSNVDTDIRFRPRFDSHDAAGVPLTGDPPEMFSMIGETLTFAVTNASGTGVVFKVRIKFHRGFKR